MLVIRFLFGAGEAGAWPNMARTFSRWIPRSERGTIQGIFFAAAHATGGLTPLIALAGAVLGRHVSGTVDRFKSGHAFLLPV